MSLPFSSLVASSIAFFLSYKVKHRQTYPLLETNFLGKNDHEYFNPRYSRQLSWRFVLAFSPQLLRGIKTNSKPGLPIFNYPILLLALFDLLGSLLMIYIPPRASLRVVPFILLFIYGVIAIFYGNSGTSSYSHFAKYVIAAHILGTTDAGLLRLESPPSSATTSKLKLKWTVDQHYNPRRIGTTNQPKKLPRFPIQKFAWLSDSDVFVISRILMAWFCYLLWRILDVFQGFYQVSLQAGDYGPDKEQFFRRIHQVTLRETSIRMVLPIMWILPEMLSISAHHYFVSAVAVFIGGSKSIPDWSYVVYGSVTEAYTIRRYWG